MAMLAQMLTISTSTIDSEETVFPTASRECNQISLLTVKRIPSMGFVGQWVGVGTVHLPCYGETTVCEHIGWFICMVFSNYYTTKMNAQQYL